MSNKNSDPGDVDETPPDLDHATFVGVMFNAPSAFVTEARSFSGNAPKMSITNGVAPMLATSVAHT